MFKHLACAALAVVLLACGTESGREPEGAGQHTAPAQVVPVSELLAGSENGRVVIDLRDSSTGYLIERGVDYSAVDVLCPGDRRMNLERWVPELASEFQVAPAELQKGLLVYASNSRGDFDPTIPVCQMGCYAHNESGRWTCFCPDGEPTE